MSAYPSLISPLMNAQGLITTNALNNEAQAALSLASINEEQIQILQETSLQRLQGNYRGTIGAGLVLRDADENTVLNVNGTSGAITSTGTIRSTATGRSFAFQSSDFTVQNTGDVSAKSLTSGGLGGLVSLREGTVQADLSIQASTFNNVGSSFAVDSLGNTTVNELTYTTLNPPITPGATPSLSEVLAVSGNGGNQPISNIENLYVNNVINTPVRVETETLSILNDGGTGYHVMTSNASGVDLNTKFTCELVNGVSPQFKPTYDYYVSKGGNDTEGLGSILSPYLTIQKAITVCEALFDGVPRVVNVSAGSYVENLTLTKSRISIVGEGQSSRPDVGTSISGTITITIASGNSDLNNNNIYFSNFLINGQFEDNTPGTNVPHRVFFDRCQLYANDRVLYLHSAGDYRAFVSNCVISNDNTAATNPVVECYSSSTGMVSFTSNQITSKGTSQNVFKLSGSCRTDTYAQNILTSDSTGTNVAIAIFVHSSTATITLGQNAFVYSSAGAKRNAETASGIFMNAASAGGSLVIANNIFGLTGLPTGQNAVQNNSAAGVVIFGGNISTSSFAGTSATGISGTLNATKFAMTAVQ